mgnify:FL=1
MPLLSKACAPCEGTTPPLSSHDIASYQAELRTPWEVIDGEKIRRTFSFKNFVEAIKFVNKVAALAETEGHHPDIAIHYNKVDITLWTHAIDGLSENDFILAAKIENLI